MAAQLTEGDRRTLLLLARMPLLWEYAIEQVYGLRGDTSVYRCLGRLRERGLIDEIRPALRAGPNPSHFYLTDLGIATIAVDQQIDPADLAQQGRLRGPDLRRRLRRIAHMVGLYQLLAALASMRPGTIDLLAWEEPWRRWLRRPMHRSPVKVELPAYAALSWDDDLAEYLLLPDLATYPLRALHRTLGALISLNQAVGTGIPTLVIATTDERLKAWSRLLDDLARSRRAAPLAARVVTWRALGDGTLTFDDVATPIQSAAAYGVQRLTLRALGPRKPGGRIPRLVGDIRRDASVVNGEPGSLALEVSPMERRLLDLVGRHPFLSAESLAVVLGWQVRRLRRRRAHLIELGLAGLVGASECKHPIDQNLTELTRTGLAFVADQQGLSLAQAVRLNGLAGGGPSDPIGMRGLLVRDLEHTRGADATIVGLYRLFAATADVPDGDAVLEWRSASACSGRRVRPDGYCMVRRLGEEYGFFLEYDRGTMSFRDYGSKWSGYYNYLESRAYERDYDGFPTILVVTTDKTAEDRIARSALAASVGRYTTLPILLTCGWRVDRDPSNPDGLLGRIWRDPYADAPERRGWPIDPLPARPSMVRVR